MIALNTLSKQPTRGGSSARGLSRELTTTHRKILVCYEVLHEASKWKCLPVQTLLKISFKHVLMICKIAFLDFVHRLYFNKLQRFGRYIFSRLQVKKGQKS
jgi:hypothetical protein